jgi:hypothetical protein
VIAIRVRTATPLRLALLRAEGGWRLPPDAGCREGRTLAGGAQCEIQPAGAAACEIWSFASARRGLDPQAVRADVR